MNGISEKITSSTPNKTSMANMTTAVLTLAKQLGCDIPDDFSKNMSEEQLSQELTKFQELVNKTKDSNQYKSLRKGLDQMTPAERLAQNLNGVNTSTLDASKSKTETTRTVNKHKPPSRQKDVDEEDLSPTNVVHIERRILHVRPKIKIDDVRNVNVTNLIKNFILRMRKANPLLRILPMDPTNKSAEDELESEKVLPDTQEGMTTWIQNVEIKGM